MKKNLFDLLKGTFLVRGDASRNWRFILYLSFLALILIASAHQAEGKVHGIAALSNEVKELRSQFMEGRKKLMRLKMETYIISEMRKKGLVSSAEPPVKIIVKPIKK